MIELVVSEKKKILSLESYVQPIIDFNDASRQKIEFLTRFYTQDQELIAPNNIFANPLNKEHFQRLDEEIFAKSLEQFAKYDLPYHELAINVSEMSVENYDSFLPNIQHTLTRTCFFPEQIFLEINERSRKNLEAFVREASKLGFKISVDDLGVENSSIGKVKHKIIKNLASDDFELKIDGSFTKELLNPSNSFKNVDSAFAQMVVALRKDFPKMSIVAEAIETEETATYLKNMGVTHGQGYYFARPVPLLVYSQKFPNSFPYLQDIAKEHS